jgi:hypothetical protein
VVTKRSTYKQFSTQRRGNYCKNLATLLFSYSYISLDLLVGLRKLNYWRHKLSLLEVLAWESQNVIVGSPSIFTLDSNPVIFTDEVDG